MNTIKLPSGQTIPALGMGTWRMGENHQHRQQEVAALRRGLELGVKLIDTAEMYGEGGAEEVVAEAVKGRRPNVFLVSKVYPHNASKEGVIAACNRSLKRLNTDYLDLYLLHWRGTTPLSETLAAFETLKQAGKIENYGVSNFDIDDMKEVTYLSKAKSIAVNQVLYNLTRRGIELDLLPWCQERNIPIMAYSPIEQGRLMGHKLLKQIAKQKGASEAQVAIAWLLHQENVIVIPKASKITHVEQNYAACDIRLSQEDIAKLEMAFPQPDRPIPLQIL